MNDRPEDASYRNKHIQNENVQAPQEEERDKTLMEAAWEESLHQYSKKEKKDSGLHHKESDIAEQSKFLNLFYALQRHAKRILAYDLDKEIKGKQTKQEKEKEEKFAQVIIEQQLQQSRELGRLIDKERGKDGNKAQKELEEKQIRPEMHAVRAPGLQAGEKPPTPKAPQGLKHDFSGKPAQAGLGMVAEELKEQSFVEQLKNKGKVDKGGMGGIGGI